MTTRQEREDFFYEHAGYGWNAAAGQSEEDGHRETARTLARAEEIASSRGWYVATGYDYDDGADPDDDGETTRAIESGDLVRLVVSLCDEDGRMIDCLGSVIVPSEDDPYIRVVGAELASEALSTHQECHARVTCGGCGHAWCEACDPAPSALCHWCHGRGWSDAELPAVYSAG